MALIDIKTKQDLIKLKRDLRKQFTQEKFMEQDLYNDAKKVYKPLIEPLTKMVEETKQTRLALKDAPRELLTIKPAEKLALDPPDPKGADSKGLVGPIAKAFLSLAFKPGSEYDKAYGIKFDGKNAKLGDTIVSIQGDDLGIGNKVFEGTVGLWELLTKQAPENFDKKDVVNYLTILRQTKAHLRPDGTIKANRGDKYYKFIRPLYKTTQKEKVSHEVARIRAASPTSSRDPTPESRPDTDSDVSGSGIIVIPSNVNEIVARHHLLFSSLNAGNTGVFNELQALTHELYKRNLFNDHDVKLLNDFCLRKWNPKA
jgi:hypothetical protein